MFYSLIPFSCAEAKHFTSRSLQSDAWNLPAHSLFVLIYTYFRKISAARRTLENPSSWSWEELLASLSDYLYPIVNKFTPFPPYLLSLAV